MRTARKMWKRISVFFLMLVMVIGPMTLTANASGEKEPLGYAIISVEKFSIGQGYVVEPERVPFYEDSNGAQLVLDVLEEHEVETSYTGSIDSGFYLSSITEPNSNRTAIFNETITKAMADNGTVPENPRGGDSLGEFDYTFSSGWVYTIDNVRANYGFSDLRPGSDLKDGSVIRVQFTAFGYGGDLGIESDYYTSYVPVVNRDELTKLIAQVNENWAEYSGDAEVMDAYETAMEVVSNTENTTDVTNQAADQLQLAMDEFAKPDTEELVSVIKANIAQKYLGTTDPWGIIEACADGNRDNLTAKEEFLQAALGIFKSENPSATDMEKYIMAVSALGINANAVPDGDTTVNAIEKMAQVFNANYNEETQSIAVNSLIFALNAYDSGAYEIPEEQEINTRDGLVNLTLDKRTADGGWAFYGSKYDPDMTAMALHALAPYYTAVDAKTAGIEEETYEKVRQAVDGAVEMLATAYQQGGTFGGRSANSNTISIVITAFHALGIDSHTDERFIKDGVSALDNLLTFALDTQDGFKWMITDSKENAMATEQAYRALVSYVNFKNSGDAYNIYNCGVEVIPPLTVNVTGVTLDKNSAVLEVGENLQLQASVFPENATNKNLIWTSSNESYAVVDKNGLVTAGNNTGETVITVKTEDGNFVASCKIQVKNTVLENAKAVAEEEVRGYKQAEDYRQAEQEQLADIIQKAIGQIGKALTPEEINTIVAEAKEEMDALKTDAQWKEEEGETGGQEEGNKTITNEEYNATIRGEDVKDGMKLEVSPLKVTDEAVKAMQEEIPSTKALISLYDYRLTKDGKEVTLNAPVTLTFQVDEKYNGMELAVLRWADGKVETLYGKVENGVLSVTTDKLGSFAVVVEAESVKDPQETEDENGQAGNTVQTNTSTGKQTATSVKTGDQNQAALFLMMAALALCASLVSKKRKVR